MAGSMKNTYRVMMFFSFLFALEFFLVYNQVYNSGRYESDFPGHILLAKNILHSKVEVPHPLFHYTTYFLSQFMHVSIESVATIIISLALVGYGALAFLFIRKNHAKNHSIPFLLEMIGISLIVSAIYLPFFNPKIYMGQLSPNVWHSPTIFMVRPFVLCCMIGLIEFLERPAAQRKISYYLILAALIWCSLLAKPNFVMVFLPAAGMLVLIKFPKRLDIYLKVAVIFAPALFYLGFQYYTTYGRHRGDSAYPKVIFDFLGVWKQLTPNVSVSVMLAVAFPLALVLCRMRQLLNNNGLLLAWLVILFGIIQFALFAECGKSYGYGNFGWGYIIALGVLFLFSIDELLLWMTELESAAQPGWTRGLFAFCLSLLFLHLASGIYFLGRILSGYSYSS